MTEQTLRGLFDYQRFSDNEALNTVIRDTDSRFPVMLDDSDLDLVNAAGSSISNFINAKDSATKKP